MKVIGLTEIGNYRKVNEDNFFVSTNSIGGLPNLFLVADGLGGHSAGDVAAKITVDTVVQQCNNLNNQDVANILLAAYLYANEEVASYGKSNNKAYEMGSTLVALTVLVDRYIVANVGDSRAYLFRNGKIKQLTKDHSLVQQLQEEGVITEEEAFTHEKKNIILQAIGMEPEINPDIFEIPAQENDILMLCSDGLSNFLRENEIEEILKEDEKLEELAHKLVNKALDNNSTDNITIVLVKNVRGSEEDIC